MEFNKNIEAKYKVYFQLAEKYNSSKYDSSIFYYKRILNRAAQNEDRRIMSRAEMGLGLVFIKKGVSDSSLNFELNALSDAMACQSSGLIAQAYNDLGITSAETGNFKEAIEYYRKALQFPKTVDEVDSIPYKNIFRNLAVSFGDLNQFDSANYYNIKALKIEQRNKDTLDEVLSLENIAINLINQSKFSESFPYLNQAKQLLDKKQNIGLESFLYQIYSYSYNLQKDYSKSVFFGEKALVGLNTTRFEARMSEVFGFLAEGYSKTGYYSKGFSFLKLKMHIDSIIDKRAKAEEIKNLSLRFDLKSKQINISNLMQKNNADQAMFFVILFSCILLFLVLCLLIYSYYKIKSLNKKLSRQHEEIRIKNKDLDELSAMKTKLFSIVSHDLKGPLFLIKNLLPNLKNNSLNSINQDKLIQLFNENIEITIDFIDNLLIWSSIQIEGFSLKPQYFNLHDLVSNNVRDFQFSLMEKKISYYEKEIVDNLNVLGDIKSVQLVFRNLFSNAIKYSEFGSLIQVEISQEIMDQEKIKVAIKNFGNPITPQIQESLFLKIVSNKLGTSGEKGYGIGLFLSNYLIKKNGGEIGFESNQISGTTFWFTLPRQFSSN